MSATLRKFDMMEVLILAVSIYVAAYLLVVSLSGQIWYFLEPEIVALSLTLLVAGTLTTTSMIFTHSLLHYSQKKEVRYFVLLLMAFDAAMLCVMFLITHPSFEIWFSLADRNRNRSLAILWGMVLMLASLAGSFSGDKMVTPRIHLSGVVLGLVFLPVMAFWFLLNPEPVFISTESSGGLAGLTPTGWMFILILGLFMSLSFLKFILEWFKSRENVLLASTMSMFFWLYALITVVILEDPFQLAEVLWVGSVTAGFSLITIAMLSTAILEPRKQLENTVETRTKELVESKQESEFYLGMWTHKMGNLLQGLLVYLDLLQIAEESGTETRDYRRSSMEIAREASLLNLQVTKLSQAKDRIGIDEAPISLASIISSAMDLSSKLLNPEVFRINFMVRNDVKVLAHEMMNVAILSLLSFFVKTRLHSNLNITIMYESADDMIFTHIDCVGEEISSDFQDFLEFHSVPQSPTIELDLYVARTIVELFGGDIKYTRLADKKINRFIIRLEKQPKMSSSIA